MPASNPIILYYNNLSKYYNKTKNPLQKEKAIFQLIIELSRFVPSANGLPAGSWAASRRFGTTPANWLYNW